MNQLATFNKPAELMEFLNRSKPAIEMALPKHLNPDRMLRLAVTAFSTTPALRKCTGISILSSIIVASQLGLEPNIGGQGYLIPYKDACTFVPGWQGLVGLLNNSGRATAWTGAVFDGDVWDFQLGSAPRCVHIPGPNYGDPDKLTWVYACGKVNGSEQPIVEAWPMSRVIKHRNRFNKVGQKHYSFEHPEMYARKVVLLQVLKYMPKSIELQNAIVAAKADERGNIVQAQDGVIVEVDSEKIPEGRVGKSKDAAPAETSTEGGSIMEQADAEEAAREKGRDQSTASKPETPVASDAGAATPSSKAASGAIIEELIEKGRTFNYGRKTLTAALVEAGAITEGQKIEDCTPEAASKFMTEKWPEKA